MQRHVELIRAEGTTLGSTARVDPTLPVPRYPGWRVIDVVVHTGSVHRRTLRIVEERATTPVDRIYPDVDEPDEVLAWYDDGLDDMIEALAGADGAAEVWGLVPSCTVGWWARRMAVETALHRWDAESAGGTARPLDGDLAVEAIDEFGQLQGPRLAGRTLGPSDSTLLLEATDRPARWLVRAGTSGLEIGRTEGGGGASISGTASDLYLDMVGRRAGAIGGSGPEDVLAAWRSAVGSLPDATR